VHQFLVLKNTKLPAELVKISFHLTWHHYYCIIHAVLESFQTDSSIQLACLNSLRYSIASSKFLNLKIERDAFIAQLGELFTVSRL